jgi:triosephosphate isomerase
MNTSLDEARALAAALPSSSEAVQVGIAPPFPWIVPLRESLTDASIWIGAQTAEPQPSGAATGDISVAMIAPYVDFVIVGHSERRQNHPMPVGTWRATVDAAIASGRVVILCVGELLADRESGTADAFVEAQLEDAVTSETARSGKLLVAYEPVWAIGTGLAASADDAAAMALVIDRWFAEHTDVESGRIPVLYGGSANAANAADFLAQPLVSGLLVGSASLNPESFSAMVRTAS